ncbi:MAG: flavodoxin [Patescibacteria group bacterium]|nr:hypothetical protein [Patescibacteria group bacterium]
MKTLVVFYSRTGNTKKVAQKIIQSINSDSEEIFDASNIFDSLGYLRYCKEAILKELPRIKKTKKDPSKYDLVVIGTPIWVYTLSSPIRTYLEKNKNKFKKVAFFCTQGASGAPEAFKEMQRICRQKPLALLTLLTEEVRNKKNTKKVAQFTKKLKQNCV